MSYASEDRSDVRPYYGQLKSLGFDPWMDVECILPGASWEQEIQRAAFNTDVYLLFLSPNSVGKRGFVQWEANQAIQRISMNKPEDITVIPVIIEPCEVPSHISQKLQYIDVSSDGWGKVVAALRKAAEQRNLAITEGVVHGPFTVHEEVIDEEWDGRPGYTISSSYPRFTSLLEPEMAVELSATYKARAINGLLSIRRVFLEQAGADDPWANSQNSLNETYSVEFVNDVFLNVVNSAWFYSAGAAHGNSGFSSDVYLAKDKLVRLRLMDFFKDQESAINLISTYCIEALKRQYWERTGEPAEESDISWFKDGTRPAWPNFDTGFSVGESAFTFRFPPYQVHCYAMGSWSVEVPYYQLRDAMNSAEASAYLLRKRY